MLEHAPFKHAVLHVEGDMRGVQVLTPPTYTQRWESVVGYMWEDDISGRVGECDGGAVGLARR